MDLQLFVLQDKFKCYIPLPASFLIDVFWGFLAWNFPRYAGGLNFIQIMGRGGLNLPSQCFPNVK